MKTFQDFLYIMHFTKRFKVQKTVSVQSANCSKGLKTIPDNE